MEALLRTGARNINQIDELLRAVKDEGDSETPLRVIRILLATKRNSVLEHFLNERGLSFLHRWLSEWSLVDAADVDASDAASAGGTTECLKLLRQLPVTKEQLHANADLCRRLRKISKSSANVKAAVIAKEVVEQWKAEVLGGGGGGGVVVVDLFHREEDKSHKENADKHSEINLDAESKKGVELGRKFLKTPSKSELPKNTGSSVKTSSASTSQTSNGTKNVYEEKSKSVEDCSFFAAAICANEDPARRAKKRPLDKTGCSEKMKNYSIASPASTTSIPSPTSTASPSSLTKPKPSGSSTSNLTSVDSNPADPHSQKEVAAVNNGCYGEKESPDRSLLPDSTVKTASKKRVSWNSELEQVFIFQVLPPENENEEDPKPWKNKKNRSKSWGESWSKPCKLADDTFPMPFIQPGSQSVEKPLRETIKDFSWSAYSSRSLSRFESVLDATPDTADLPFPHSVVPIEIPLERVDDDDDDDDDDSTCEAKSREECPFSTPKQYNLFPSPPYSES